jgi:hypothetical protein
MKNPSAPDLTRFHRFWNDQDRSLTDRSARLTQLPPSEAQTFGGGAYRILAASNVNRWTSIVGGYFTAYAGSITCFGYDWMGRMFGQRVEEDGQEGVVRFDPAAAEVVRIPAGLQDFHCIEIVEYADDSIALSDFQVWRRTSGRTLALHECVGFKVPLFLGGTDSPSNLEVQDIEVMWELSRQFAVAAGSA